MLRQRTALWALAVIFAANFLNYTDRQLVSALEQPITTDPALELDSEAFGWLWSYFTIGYMICAVPIGLLADRYRRTAIFAVCIAVWSVATVATGLAQSKWVLNIARIFIGVGEAGCLVIGPSLLSDYFTTAVRGRALSIFYLGMSLGGATAFILPWALKRVMGWREMFYVAGVPGFGVALLVVLLPEPPRGAKDSTAEGPHNHGGGSLADYLRLLKTPTLLLIILAQAFAVAVLVPLVHFGKEYLEKGRRLTEEQASLSMLGILIAGIVGNLLSGLIGDRLARRIRGAYALLAGVGYLAALAALQAAFRTEPLELFLAGLIVGSFFLFLCMPAVNTQIANVTSPRQRGAAWALAVFILHLLGDTASPPLFGKTLQEIGSRQQTFIYFSFALVPAALCCFLATLTARADARRVERESEEGPVAESALGVAQ
jgi:predicted MFS family arabinose efflux permease